MAKSGLLTATTVKNTIENARLVTVHASNKDTVNNVVGLTLSTQAINTKEIARGTAALLSNYDTVNN